MRNRKKLDILIAQLIDNGISFEICPTFDRYECSAGYNQNSLREILDLNKVAYHFSYGHYWWDV
jgi:hypothetical protein